MRSATVATFGGDGRLRHSSASTMAWNVDDASRVTTTNASEPVPIASWSNTSIGIADHEPQRERDREDAARAHDISGVLVARDPLRRDGGSSCTPGALRIHHYDHTTDAVLPIGSAT